MLKHLVLLVIFVLSSAGTWAGTPHAGSSPKPLTRFVIYYNSDATPATALVGLPYTHVILSFVTASADASGAITLVTPDKLAGALGQVAALQADGKLVLISFGGGDMTAQHYLSLIGHENALASALAAFVKHHGLDGMDIDFEISATLHTDPPLDLFDGRQFLVTLTTALRAALGDTSLLTHAPQPPYLDPDWHDGPYLQILGKVGPIVDWITVQYYNNPGFNDPLGAAAWSYDGVVSNKYGLSWPPGKTLVGKPVYIADAGTGYLAPQELATTVIQPLVSKYGDQFGGLTGWQFSAHTPQHLYWNNKMADSIRSQSAP
jgi:chitinase